MAGTFKKLTYTIAAALVAVLCFLITSQGGGAGYAFQLLDRRRLLCGAKRLERLAERNL